MTDSKDLLKRCKAGDQKASRQLYDLFKASLMGVCLRYTRSREEAQDVLQESFIKIFSKIGQVDSAEKLPGWLTSVVVRTAINYYHKNKTHNLVFLPMSKKETEIGVDTALATESSGNFILDLVNTLPQGCRIIFNLAVVEGYEYHEISNLLNISEGTCRSQLHRAKQLLQKKLKSKTLAEYYEKLA